MHEEHRQKVKDITESLANYFDKEEVEVGVVMSVLVTMCVHTMLRQGNMPPQDAIRIFAEAVCHAHDNDEEGEGEDEDNEGEVQWLN